ncbi:MAG TPA: MarR family transcriptional regulator [Gammaproteobacteria bacterium]|nr:MarR family transcriptional regulator [Gammaproteobacteria bacterium]
MQKVNTRPEPSSEHVANALAMLAAQLPRVLRARDSKPQLMPAELSALAVLVHGGAMNLKELARHEQVTPASISRTARVLEAKKLISRQKDKLDARGSIVQPTREGARVFHEGHARKLAPLVQWIDQLPPVSRQRLGSVVDILEAVALLDSEALRL